MAAPPGAVGGIAPPRNAAPGSGRHPQSTPLRSPFGNGCRLLNNPPVCGFRRSQPPLTRGPNQPADVPAAARFAGGACPCPTCLPATAATRCVCAAAGCGTMQASSPTQVRGNARIVVSRLAATLKNHCRGGFHIRPGGVCGIEDRADIESAPTRVRNKIKITVSRLVAGPARNLPPLSKGGGRAARRGRRIAPPRNAAPRKRPPPAKYPPAQPFGNGCRLLNNPPVCGFRRSQPPLTRGPNQPAGSGGMGHPALRVIYVARRIGVSRCAPAVGRRGGIYPSRGCSRRRKVCGRGMPRPARLPATPGPPRRAPPALRFFPRGPAAATVIIELRVESLE